MAIICKLTDGVTEIDLYYSVAAGISLLDEGFKPSRPEMRALYAGVAEDKLVRRYDGKRQIPLDLYFEGSNENDLINRINNVQRLIHKAQDSHLLDLATKVYLDFKLATGTYTTRFTVIDGEIDIDRLMSLFCKDEATIDKVSVVLTCEPYWESVETYELGPFNISNDPVPSDGPNYVDVTAIPGEMPVLVKITLENTYNSERRAKTVHIAQRTQGEPHITPVLQGESATLLQGGQTGTGSGYSGDEYATWTGLTAADWTTIAYWDIDPSDVNEWGGLYKIIGRADSWPTNARWRLKTTYYSITTHEVGKGQAGLGFESQNFGNFALPPWRQREGNPDVFRVELQVKVLSGSASLVLDYLFCLPLDGLQIVGHKGYNCLYGASMVIDGINEEVYDLLAGERAYIVYSVGDFIHLLHRGDQRLFFLTEDDVGKMRIERTWRVWLTYRLRGVHLRGTE